MQVLVLVLGLMQGDGVGSGLVQGGDVGSRLEDGCLLVSSFIGAGASSGLDTE